MTSSSRPGTRAALSLFDFTDTANPVEIAYFDRGPINTPNPTAQPRRPTGRRTGTTATSTAPRSRAASTSSALTPSDRCRRTRSTRRRGAARRVQRAAPVGDRARAELRGRALVPRPGRAHRLAERRCAERGAQARRRRRDARRGPRQRSRRSSRSWTTRHASPVPRPTPHLVEAITALAGTLD